MCRFGTKRKNCPDARSGLKIMFYIGGFYD